MPQLRWTLLFLGVLFVILLAWIERRRQRRQGFTDTTTVEREPGAGLGHGSSGPGHGSSGLAHGSSGSGAENAPDSMFRGDPAFTLPEMRAAREPAPPQDLPIVEIEDDSLNARRVEVGEPLMDPPTLSLPVVDSGPEIARRRPAEPTVSDFDSLDLGGTDYFEKSVSDFQVPRLDTPAPKNVESPKAAAAASSPAKPVTNKINLADTYVGTGAPAARLQDPSPFRPQLHTRHAERGGLCDPGACGQADWDRGLGPSRTPSWQGGVRQ